MNAPGLLAHRQHAIGGLLVGGEMQMRELGHGVAHRIVERAALGDVAALHMRGRHVHLRAGDDRGKALETVGIDDQQLGFQIDQSLTDRDDARADRLRGGIERVRFNVDLDLGMNGEAVIGDFLQRACQNSDRDARRRR